MAKRIKDLKVPLGFDLEKKLDHEVPGWKEYRILKKSLDARGDSKPKWIYTLDVGFEGDDIAAPSPTVSAITKTANFRPLVVGAGPAGLFAALRLAERGLKPILFERGSSCNQRILAINKFWRYGVLDKEDNVCFGEGGAGLYSDGKLITRIKSPHIPYIMDRLVECGAPDEIKYLSNPHVGSDKIRRVIPKLRQKLQDLGCDFLCNSKVENLIFEGEKVTGIELANGETFKSSVVILATGHSATDMFYNLHKWGVALEGKSFALGLRIEHHQEQINKIQYGPHSEHPELSSANYKLTHHDKLSHVGVYSFCMCPGGYVLSSGTEEGGLVCNGMSNYSRNSPFANSAIVVSVDHERSFGSDLFGGMKMRERIEKDAFTAVKAAGGTKQLPSQDLMSFMSNTDSTYTRTSSPSGVIPVRLDKLLPNSIYLRLVEAFEHFDKKMPGFLSPEAQLHGVETRTSCPLRIVRDSESLMSISHKGLYPIGEGAGYAGGITSAACDGVRAAESVVNNMV